MLLSLYITLFFFSSSLSLPFFCSHSLSPLLSSLLHRDFLSLMTSRPLALLLHRINLWA